MIYSQTHLTGERPHDCLFPPNSQVHRVLLRRPPPLPVNTHSQSDAHVCLSTNHTPLQELFVSEWLGHCVCGTPCPLKRALINDYLINQEVLAGLKRLWGQGSAEVLNQFPIPRRLDIFCFLAARRFIIILPQRRNGRGMAGGLDVGGTREWGENRGQGSKKWKGWRSKVLYSLFLSPTTFRPILLLLLLPPLFFHQPLHLMSVPLGLKSLDT